MRGRPTIAAGLIWLTGGWFVLASSVSANNVSPLPASDYTVRSVCAAPAAGRVGCVALRLLPRTASARAETHPLGVARSGPIAAASAADDTDGLGPSDLQRAYFPGERPDAPAAEPQTIALVDVYDDLEAEADLKVYDEEFSLSECTVADGCFEQVNQNGETGSPPFPSSAAARRAKEALCEDGTAEPAVKEAACKEVEEADSWAAEVSIDIEIAHAVCQNCHIALVEANEPEVPSLEAAENTAARPRSEGGVGANEISNSWGGPEPPLDVEAFNHPGIVITAASLDDGYLNWARSKEEESEGVTSGVNYLAASPHVVAVGGTSLTLNGPAEAWGEETVWYRSGGGCSPLYEAPAWQRNVPDWSSAGCGSKRAVADVSADANPYTGVAIYDSVPYVRKEGGKRVTEVFYWTPAGGTSVASPIIAAMFALAGGSHGVEYPAQTLYSHLGSASLHDITEGSNGECGGEYSSGCSGSMSPLSLTDCGEGVLICNAAPGYDGASGVGTPNGVQAFKPARQHTHGAGSPEAPLTEACGGPIFADTGRVCGTLNPHVGAKAGYYFAYDKGATCTGGKETSLQSEVQGQAIPVSGELFGLEPDTQYSACLIATNPSGETEGPAVTFTTEPAAPRPPDTRAAIDVTTDSATLEGMLGPQPIATNWHFDYAIAGTGCDGNGAKTTPEAQDTTLGEPDEVSAPITGLAPGTEYTACLIAENRIGSTTGTQGWFTTEPIPPTVESVAAKGTGTEASFEAQVDPNAPQTTCEVQYGTSESYGSKVPCKEALGTSGHRTSASAHAAGLEPDTIYHYQVIVENEAGKSLPSEGKGTFKTQMVTPGVTGEFVSEVSTTTAVLAGALDPEMARTRYYLEYGETEAYGQRTPGSEVGASAGEVQVGPETITGLKPGTTYYVRLRAVNAWNEAVGEAKTFTTLTISSPIVAPLVPIVIPITPVTITPTTTTATPNACSVSLASARITVKGASEATIKLTGTGTCSGKLTLTVKTKGKKGGNQRRSRTTTIGTATFSILTGKTVNVELGLDAAGRALLGADHGRLSATLTVLKSSPAPSQTHSEGVRLVQQKIVKARKAAK